MPFYACLFNVNLEIKGITFPRQEQFSKASKVLLLQKLLLNYLTGMKNSKKV